MRCRVVTCSPSVIDLSWDICVKVDRPRACQGNFGAVYEFKCNGTCIHIAATTVSILDAIWTERETSMPTKVLEHLSLPPLPPPHSLPPLLYATSHRHQRPRLCGTFTKGLAVFFIEEGRRRNLHRHWNYTIFPGTGAT
jgi:hypothetical protein